MQFDHLLWATSNQRIWVILLFPEDHRRPLESINRPNYLVLHINPSHHHYGPLNLQHIVADFSFTGHLPSEWTFWGFSVNEHSSVSDRAVSG